MKLPPVAILAGGLATRLRPITETIPKALVEVAGRPFILHQFDLLRKAGIRRVVLCVGYLGEMIQETLGDGHQYGLEVTYSFDGALPLGTAGALQKALPLLGDDFYILYGDTYLDCDYADIYMAFQASDKLGLMTVYRNENRLDKSNVVIVDGQILVYNKRHPTPEMQFIDYGLGLLKADVIASLQPPADLADVYLTLVQQKQLASYEVFQRFYEIGSLAALQETEHYLATKGT